MAAQNINRVILTGNLTRDPETRTMPSGGSVTSLRIAVNGRRKNNQTQQWEDKPNYFDVTVWGAQGENVSRYLTKGSGIAIDGRLDWREWQDQQGNKRQSVEVIADNVQFLNTGGGQGGGQGGYSQGGGYGGGQQGGSGYGGGGQPGGYESGGGYGGQGGERQQGGGSYGQPPAPAREPQPVAAGYGQRAEAPVDTSDFAPAPPRGGLSDPGEDDIPF